MGFLDDLFKSPSEKGKEDGTKQNKDFIKYALDEHYRKGYDYGEGLKDGSESMKHPFAGPIIEVGQKMGKSEEYKRGHDRGKATYGTAGDVPPKLFGDKENLGRGGGGYSGRSSNGSGCGRLVLVCILVGLVLVIVFIIMSTREPSTQSQVPIEEVIEATSIEGEPQAKPEEKNSGIQIENEIINNIPNTQPVIDSVTDSLGHVYTNSWAKDTSGAWTKGLLEAAPTIYIGDTITFTINVKNASDLLYIFEYSNAGHYWTTIQDWSNSNTCTWIVPNDAGGTFYGFGPRQTTIIAGVKNKDELNYLGDVGDDCTYLIYIILTREPSRRGSS